MDKITLPANVVEAVLEYLARQPYNNVAQLIGAIQKQIIEQQPTQEETTDE